MIHSLDSTHHLMMDAFHTHTWTHIRGPICQKSFSGQVISFMNKHKLSCVEIHAVTLKICARQSQKLVHDHLPVPPAHYALHSHLPHVSNLPSSSSRVRQAERNIRMKPAPSAAAFSSEGLGVSLWELWLWDILERTPEERLSGCTLYRSCECGL